MTEKFVEVPACKNCGVAITQKKWDNALKAHWLPLCEKCEPEIKAKYKEWSPIFQKFKFHR